MSQNLSTPIRRIPLLLSVLVVLIIVLLLSLTLFLSSGGAFRSASSGGYGPNGITNGSMINPDGLAAGSGMDGNGNS